MTNPVVFDYLPPGVLPLTNDAIDDAIERASRVGPAEATWDAMLDEGVTQLRTDDAFAARLRAAYDRAGVSLVSPTVWSFDPSVGFREGVYRDLARWTARIEALDWLRPVRTPEEARAVAADGDVGIVLNVQNAGAFTAGTGSRVDDLVNAGVRIVQLTYNTQNHVGAGCTEPSGSGLSNHGLDVVERLDRHGAVIDLSHCNRETTLDAVGASRNPVCATHTHCGALHDHPRAKSDAELEAIADSDGYVGVLVYPHHYDEPTFDAFADHLEHAIDVLGIDRVGIGTDWAITTADVPESLRPGVVSFIRRATDMTEETEEYEPFSAEKFDTGLGRFRTYEDRGVIREELEARGYDEDEVAGLLGENFVAFWERVREE